MNEQKDKNIKTRVSLRPFRILGLIFWFVVMAAGYIMFRSFLILFILSFLCLIPILSVISILFLIRGVSTTAEFPNIGYYRPGDDVRPCITLLNSTYMVTLDARIGLRFCNTLFPHISEDNDTEESRTHDDKITITLPVASKGILRRMGQPGRSEAHLPFTTTRIGGYMMYMDEVIVQDWFGLVKIHLSSNLWKNESSFVTLPVKAIGTKPDPESISSGMTEVSESNRQGNDFSEVTDIREYIPGDRIRDIHWKASARTEEWMVKVRTQMAGMELTVLILPDEDEHLTESILTYAYQELITWAEGDTDINLKIYSKSDYGFDSYTITRAEDVDGIFADIFMKNYTERIPDDSTTEGLDAVFKNLYPYIGGYIRIGMCADGTIGWEVVEGARS